MLILSIEKYEVTGQDGKTRTVTSERESSQRFDHTKHEYSFDGIERRYVKINEVRTP